MRFFGQLLREPLPWFLLVGLLIFVFDGWYSGVSNDDYTINFSTGQIQSLRDKWQMQMGREPSGQELQALIEDRLREEVLYREALRMGLDQDDTIVRRRMAQKLTFLIEDSFTDPGAPLENLELWFRDNREKYQIPARYSFTHIYFGESNQNPELRARQSLSRVLAGDEPDGLGDPFMLRKNYIEKTELEVARLFGNEFATAIATLEVSAQWQGPLRSSYGYHLVLIERFAPQQQPEFQQVEQQVRDDFLDAERRQQNESRYREMRERYNITVPVAR